MTRTRIRPARPLAPMVVAVAIVGTWWLVAHNSGAGWVQALGDIVFGTLVIGICGPAVILSRARLSLTRVPTDGTAGLPLDIDLTASTRLRIRPVDPPGPETFAGPDPGRSPRSGPNRTPSPCYRIAVVCTTASASTWPRRRRSGCNGGRVASGCRLAHLCMWPPAADNRCPCLSGWRAKPATRTFGWRPNPTRSAALGNTARVTAAGICTGRPPPTPANLWCANSRDRPQSRSPCRCACRPDPEEAERVAERALGTVLRLFDRGGPVALATTEAAGPVTAPVADRRAAGRRLARAVPAPSSGPTSEETMTGPSVEVSR